MTAHTGTGYLRSAKLALVIVAVVLMVFTTGTNSASVNRRSIRQSSTNQPAEECRRNGVCGWEVYNASTRVHQLYVATTCRCNKLTDVCARAEDDIDVPAYVFRCRELPPRRNRTTPRPTSETTAGEFSS